MKAHWKYLKYVVRHKWFVFWAGVALGAPLWRLIVHDLSKFSPSEWFPYVAKFYGVKVPHPTQVTFKGGEILPVWVTPPEVELAFDFAWNYHQKRNPHHWQYWLLSPDKPRPNFWEQSYDGGMSHSFISDVNGKRAAVLFDAEIERYKEDDMKQTGRLVADLKNTPIPLPMPKGFMLEMLADWVGAGKALNSNKPAWEWYEQNKSNIFLHPDTRQFVEAQLDTMKRHDGRAMMLGFSPRFS